MAAPIATMKKDLRKKIKAVLSDLPEAAAAAQSSNATATLLAMPEYKAARRISVYLSMPTGEISTTSIVHDALRQGKQVFVPYIYKLVAPSHGQPKSIMDMLELKSLGDYESLKPDPWGIPSLSKDSVSSRGNSFGTQGITEGKQDEDSEGGLDLIIMPGMAFDSNFGRLGHGKGFYDYFLHRCHKSTHAPFRVGLSLTEQFLQPDLYVPMDTTDFRLDALILGDGDIRCAGANP